MSPEHYEYENDHAIRDDEHDYEEEEDWDDWDYADEGYDEREDLGWDGGYED